MNLKKQTISSMFWSFIGHFLVQFFNFIFILILARLLTPREFGLIGMIAIFTGFATIFGDLGLGAAIIQKLEITFLHIVSVFWINVLVGVLLTAIFIGFAPVISKFYGEPILYSLTILIAFNFLIRSFGVVPGNILTRDLKFKELALANIISILISGIVSIFLAWKGFGVWALAWQGIIASIILTLGYIIFCKWRPEFKFNYSYLKELTGYGANLLGHSTINYWLRNLDSLLIGKFIGSTELGLYTRAYSLMLLPLNNISAVIGRVMFPVLTKLQNDLVQFKQVYLQVTRLIALITFPLMFLLFVISEPLILIIYGEKWEGVIPIFKYLCLVGLVQSIVFPVAWIFQAIGRTDIQFRLTLGLGVLFVTAMLIGINFGLMGIVYAYIIISLPSAYLNLKYAGKLINLNLNEIMKVLKYIFIAGLLMATGLYLLNLLINHRLPDWMLLMINFSAGFIIYFLLIKVFKEPSYPYVINLLKEQQVFNNLRYAVTSIALKMGISESKEQ